MSYLAAGLKEKGHDVSILSLSDTRSKVVYEWDGVEVFSMPNLNIYNQFKNGERHRWKKIIFSVLDIFNPLVFLRALAYLGKRKVDVMCTNNLKGIGPAIWLAAAVRGIPIVHVIHDYWMICPSSTMFKSGCSCTSICRSCKTASLPKMFLSRLVRSVVGVSRFVLDRHVEQGFFPRSRSVVVHNSRPSMNASGDVPEKKGGFVIGFIGRLEAAKGIREFFEGVRASRLADVEIYIAGRDRDGILDELTEEYGEFDIKYFGFVEPTQFYLLVDLVVVPSMWDEPFGNVAFEPWEFGKPTIAFASGGVPEVFGDIRELVVDRGDVVSLGKLINRMAMDAEFYADIASRCAERRAYFLPDRQIGEFERVLLEIQTRDGRARRPA